MDTRRLLILFATLFSVMLGFGIIIPILPYFTEQLHGDARTVGLLMASYAAMNMLCAPAWGRLSDQIGRKRVLMAGIAGLTLSFVISGLARDLSWLFAARIVGGIFGAASLPTAMAYAGDASTPEDRAKAMGMLGAGIGLGMVVGPAIGGLAGRHDLALPFLVAAGISLCTFLFVTFVLPDSRGLRPRLSALEALRQTGRELWPFYLISFIQMLAFTGMEATFALFGKDRHHLEPMTLGLMFMAMGLISAGIQGGAVGRLIGRFGEPAVALAGSLVLALGFVATPLAPNLLGLFGAFCFYGIGSALLRTALTTGISRGASAGQGTAMGLLQSTESLARVIGPALGGLLYFLQPALPYHTGAGLMGLASLVTMATLGGRRLSTRPS